LAGPALWNGCPIIFPDTGGYLTRPLEGTLDIGRSALYGLFLLAGMPFSFWPVVLVQAAATAWLIVLVLRVQSFARRPFLALAVITATSLLSSLPWLAGQLLPDILFPLAVLAFYLLAYADKALARSECYALAALIAFAIASHMAAAGLCIGLVACTWLLGRVAKLRLPKTRLDFAAAAIAAGLILGPISNW